MIRDVATFHGTTLSLSALAPRLAEDLQALPA
jgi:hypothetical protein